MCRTACPLPQLLRASGLPSGVIADKEIEVVDLDKLFGVYACLDHVGHIVEAPPSPEKTLLKTEFAFHRQAGTAWHEALPNRQQNPALAMPNDSSFIPIKSRVTGSSHPFESLKFESPSQFGKNQLRSLSQPSTPPPHCTRSIKKAVSFDDRSIARGIEQSSRKPPSTLFSKTMQSSYRRQAIPNIDTRNMNSSANSFNGLPQSSGNLSPLPSSISCGANEHDFFSEDRQPCPNIRSTFYPSELDTPSLDVLSYQLTPQESPCMDITSNGNNLFRSNIDMACGASVSSAALSALPTPPSSLGLSTTKRGLDTSPDLGLTFPASQEFPGMFKMAESWNVDADRAQFHCDSHSRSASHSPNSADEMMIGHEISCEPMAFGNFGVVGSGVSMGEDVSGASALSFAVGSYGGFQPTLLQHNMMSIGTCQKSRSPSPCAQSRFHRRRPSSFSLTSNRGAYSHALFHRRKSTNASQPQSKQSDGSSDGFVNLTPDDSRQLLAGVAPSGSSKTKARREKEAADKRRRLSQVAIKAVLEAGGDLNSIKQLEREGVLVLESLARV